MSITLNFSAKNVRIVQLSQKYIGLRTKLKSETKTLKLKLNMNENIVKSYKKRIDFWKAKYKSNKFSLKGSTQTLDMIKKNQKKVSEQTIRKIFSRRFTNRQIKLLLNGKSKTVWNEEDISKSLCLRAKSISAYEFVRSIWKIPLPSVSTLHRWVSQIKFAPGLLNCVISMMKCEFSETIELNR